MDKKTIYKCKSCNGSVRFNSEHVSYPTIYASEFETMFGRQKPEKIVWWFRCHGCGTFYEFEVVDGQPVDFNLE